MEVFDKSAEYDEMLQRGIGLTGEDKSFFIRGRVDDLQAQLDADFRPRKVLDFGCGIGDATAYIAGVFPGAEVVGIDTAAGAIEHARAHHGSERVSFSTLREFQPDGSFDLVYTSGVFHHIAPHDRAGALRTVRDALAPGGLFALMENNPWNPGTRLVMWRIPFDRDAVPIHPWGAYRLLREQGFALVAWPRFLFYFPRWLGALRAAEPYLARLPLGGQYYLLARKP